MPDVPSTRATSRRSELQWEGTGTRGARDREALRQTAVAFDQELKQQRRRFEQQLKHDRLAFWPQLVREWLAAGLAALAVAATTIALLSLHRGIYPAVAAGGCAVAAWARVWPSAAPPKSAAPCSEQTRDVFDAPAACTSGQRADER